MEKNQKLMIEWILEMEQAIDFLFLSFILKGNGKEKSLFFGC
jgi:hypothetical protein